MNNNEPTAFNLGVDTTGAAFHEESDGDWNHSVSQLLHDVADAIAAGGRPRTRTDINGNTVCFISYEEESDNDW